MTDEDKVLIELAKQRLDEVDKFTKVDLDEMISKLADGTDLEKMIARLEAETNLDEMIARLEAETNLDEILTSLKEDKKGA